MRWHFPGRSPDRDSLRQKRKRRQRFVWRRCTWCGREGFLVVIRPRICRACASRST